jgi:ABC-type dipeptide/oligopeptide/nickel transport system permease component
LLSILLTFGVVSILLFMMMHAMPGGPFDATEMPLSGAAKATIMAQYGLDQPLYVQYFKYMQGVFQLDFGIPYQSPGETVLELLGRAWVPSLILGGAGVLIGAPIGIGLGLLAALNRNTWVDYLASSIATLGLTIPVFVTSMALILVFSVWLNWLPASGWGEPRKWILPIVAYATIPMATYARYTRSAILDTLNKPFVMVLRAKGLSERKVISKHVLRNSAIPMVTVFLPMFIGTATGSIFVEAMFRVPGLGAYFVSSIVTKDYPLEMALILMITVMFCFAYFLADIAYAILNPRIRLKEGTSK